MTPQRSTLLVRLLVVAFVVAAFGVTYGALSSRSVEGRYRWSNAGHDPGAGRLTGERVRARLATVQDRELGVTIADLGLIYEVAVVEPGKADVVMTLTVPTCPFGSQIVQDVRAALLADSSVREVDLRLTFDPPWTWDRAAPGVRERLLGVQSTAPGGTQEEEARR